MPASLAPPTPRRSGRLPAGSGGRAPLILALALLWLPMMAEDLSKADIENLLKRPPSATIVDELKIYRVSNDMRFTLSVVAPSGEGGKHQQQAREWWVDEKYVVIEIKDPDGVMSYFVKGYDRQRKLYLGWNLLPNGDVFPSVGLYDAKHKTMSWHAELNKNGEKLLFLSNFIFASETQSEWVAQFYSNDVLQFSVTGICEFAALL